jgi:integrase
LAQAPCTPWGDTRVVDNNTETALFRGGGSVNEDGSRTPGFVLLERLGQRAGIENVHAHRFRHAAADDWLRRGGSEDGLMSQMGWRSRSMIQRYAAANRQDRAREEHRKLAPGERV